MHGRRTPARPSRRRRNAAAAVAAAALAAGTAPPPPVCVGGAKQLFHVDDSLIASSRGLTRTMNPPAKLGRRVLQPDAPWERALNLSYGLMGSVLREEPRNESAVNSSGGGTTRLYFYGVAGDSSEDPAHPVANQFIQALAESADGESFRKPALGQE